MKLLSLHINNYGKLSNYDYEFKEFSSFCEENGFGKSTIASFIKSMFYGLESIKSNGTKFLDRKHFYPFKGGKFGGNIVFESGHDIFRIERDFDEKSETKDVMKVFKNNNPTTELGDNPGVYLFGINKESFERLLLINADKISLETDSDINKKLNNYVENVGEDFDIDQVIKKISNERKHCNDRVKEDNVNIRILKDDIKNLEITKESLDNMYSDLSKTEEEKNKAKDEYDKANTMGIVLAKWDYVDKTTSEIEAKKKALNDISVKYPHGLPEGEEVDGVKETFANIGKIEGKLDNNSISNDDRNEYNRLTSKYEECLPSSKDVFEIEKQILEYEALKKQIEVDSSYEKSKKETELENHFLGQDYSDYAIELVEQEVRRLKDLETELEGIRPSMLVTKKENIQKKADNRLTIGLLLAALILFGAGIGCLFAVMVLGMALIIIGGIVLILDMFIYFNSKISKISKDVTVEDINPIYDTKKQAYEKKKNEAFLLMSKYRYEGANIEILLYQLKNDAKEYKRIIEENKNREIRLKENKERLAIIADELNDFFITISMQDFSYKKAIEIVKSDIVKLETLDKIMKNNDEDKQKTVEKLNEYKKVIDEFYSTYSIDKSYNMDDIKSDIATFDRLKEEIEDSEKKLDDFKKINHLTTKPTVSSVNVKELKDIYDDLLQEYTSSRQIVDRLENEVSILDDKKNELEELKNDQLAYDEKVKLFDALKEEINKADQVLKDKYVAPIKNRFVYYANLVEKVIGEKVHMDKDYKISFDRDGQLRSFEHLSSGNLVICALCFRLALLENMFDNNLPFIIMDDPFVFLDEKHFDRVKHLVKEMAKDKQIIYFSCHESRMI